MIKNPFKITGFCSIAVLLTGITAVGNPQLLGAEEQAEAKKTVQQMNQTQEEYQTENGRFASSLEQLDFNIPQNTENYQYLVSLNGHGGSLAVNMAITRSSELKSYLGLIYFHYTRGGMLTKALICESVDYGTEPSQPVSMEDGSLGCGSGMVQWGETEITEQPYSFYCECEGGGFRGVVPDFGHFSITDKNRQTCVVDELADLTGIWICDSIFTGY